MDISIIGTGYVGLPAGAGLAKNGHNITCVDIDQEKVDKINRGECPIFEDGLPELLEELGNDRLSATTDTKKAVENSDLTFLAVGTPMKENGDIELKYIKQAARDAAKGIRDKDGYHVFVVKSTVTPKTTEEDLIPVLEDASEKKAGEDFGVCMNPEFLREGKALEDFLNPDRIVIGELDKKSGEVLGAVYRDFDAPIVRTSLRAAELIKYASNSLLATKISFINEIGNLCKDLGIDVYEIADGVGLDHRINREFLNSGAGFGGSCFPKDVRALISFMEEEDIEPRILKSTIEVNKEQKTRLIDLLAQHLNIRGKTVAVLGLAFKPGTDDVRKSPAIPIISQLKAEGAKIKAYDPEAMENMKEKHPDIQYCPNRKEALKNAHAGLIVTNWKEFENLNLKEMRKMEQQIILEGRKIGHKLPEEKIEGITWP